MKKCPVCKIELSELSSKQCENCGWKMDEKDYSETERENAILAIDDEKTVDKEQLGRLDKAYVNEESETDIITNPSKEKELINRLGKIKKFSIEKESETVLFHTRKLVEIILEDVFVSVCNKKPTKPTIETLFDGIRNKNKMIFTGINETVIRTLQIRCNQASHGESHDYGLVERQVLQDLCLLIEWYTLEFKKHNLNQELKEKMKWLKEGSVRGARLELLIDYTINPKLDDKVLDKRELDEILLVGKEKGFSHEEIMELINKTLSETGSVIESIEKTEKEEKINLLIEYVINPKLNDKILDKKELDEILLVGQGKGFSYEEIMELVNKVLLETGSVIEDSEKVEKEQKINSLLEYSIYPKIKDKLLDKKEKEEIIMTGQEKGFSHEELNGLINKALIKKESVMEEVNEVNITNHNDTKISSAIKNKGIKLKVNINKDNYVFVKGMTLEKSSKQLLKGSSVLKEDMVIDNFIICKYLVTQLEYENIIEHNPSNFINDSNPVEQVTWYDAINYANQLSESHGFIPFYIMNNIVKENNRITSATVEINTNKMANGYRLPTEAEWEYAAKGGRESKGFLYSGSNNIDDIAWFDENSDSKTSEVGKKKANELGIYDMSGNIWEWCWDCYSKNTDIADFSKAPKVGRGGSWFSGPSSAKTNYRGSYNPDKAFSTYGFRLVRTKI